MDDHRALFGRANRLPCNCEFAHKVRQQVSDHITMTSGQGHFIEIRGHKGDSLARNATSCSAEHGTSKQR